MAVGALITALVIFGVCYASDPFDNALTDTDTCSKNCSEIYQPFGPVDECQRGCRFHVIEEFVSEDQNASALKITCYGSCVEAYNENSTRTEACKKGCDVQQQFAADLKEKEAGEGPSIHLLSPLMQVRAVYSSFVGAVHIIRSSLITYFISDDNSIVAVESEPEIVLGIDPEAVARENPLLQAQQEPRQLSVGDESGEPSMVKCLPWQVGVHPYILVASLGVLVVFTLYVIMAFCGATTSSKAKAYASEKSLQVDPMALPVKLVRPEDLTRLSLTEEEDLDAPPLPTKVKLPDSLI